jgi:hypothetical protein
MVTPCELITEQMGLIFTCVSVNQYIRIQTPFLYPDGDVIDIFYKEEGDAGTLTDLGETMRWLRMQTVSQRKSLRQRQLVADICLNHNIVLYRGMLTVPVGRSEDLAGAVMKLAQGILRVSDLWFTFRNKAGESIVDEVEDLLQEHQIAFERSPRVSGRSATIWRPDFQTRRKDHNTLIRVLSTGSRAATRDLAARTSAMWHDLSYLTVGQETFKFISLFDDTLDVWNEEDFRLVGDISDIAYWSRSDELLEKVA